MAHPLTAADHSPRPHPPYYYTCLLVLWSVRVGAWLLGGYLIRVGFSVDSLKLYAAVSVLLAIAFNVLPAAVPHTIDAENVAPRKGGRGLSRAAPPPSTASFSTPRRAVSRAAAVTSSPSTMPRSAHALAEDVSSSRGTARTPVVSAPLSRVERARLETRMRVLGTAGAMRCVTDTPFRVFMLQDGPNLPLNDPCPCGSEESFARCCYGVPEALKGWAEGTAEL